MKMKKRLLTAALSITILASSLSGITAPSFATSIPSDITGHWSEPFVTSLVSQGVISGYPDGTFKPDKSISNAEFLSLTLKAMGETIPTAQTGETWDTPVLNKALSIGLVHLGEPMADAANEITREQSAMILYRALQIKEGIQYDQCYTAILDQVIFDHEQINSLYRDSVYSMLQKGVFTVSQSYFNPKGLLNRGATCVVLERVMDKEKRLEPDKDLMKNDAVQTIKISTIEPKESTTVRFVPFENGKPVIEEQVVVDELKQHPNNSFSGRLADYYDYEAYINLEWKSPFYQTYEKKKEAVDEYYDTAVNGLKVMYNYSYTDIATYEKDLKYYKVNTHSAEDWINNRINWIVDKTVVIEGQFITDKSLFYCSSDGKNRTRGRLYFIYHSPSQEAVMNDIKLKVNQWYYVDFEQVTSEYIGQGNVNWNRGDVTLGTQIYLTDFIPLEPQN